MVIGTLVVLLFGIIAMGIQGVGTHKNMTERSSIIFGRVVEINGVQYSTHDVIRINNNADFTSQNGVVSGSGTQSDPYVISDLDIDAHGEGDAIYIGNTTAYFIIKNSYLHNASPISDPYYGGIGIELYNVTNGVIENNTCSDNMIGLLPYSSFKNIISNNTFTNNLVGIELYSNSNNDTVSNNTCTNNGWHGIILDSSNNNTILNNTCTNNGYNGIFLESSNSNVLSHNICSYNDAGLYMYSSSSNTIYHNIFVNNTGYGVHIVSGSKNLIYNNAFFYNNGSGDTFNPSYIQGADDGSANYWNTSAGIGNYWRDWANNNDTNAHNGIVNWPYKIDGSAKTEDHYPLKNTSVQLPPLAPRNLKAIAGSGYINLTWNSPRGNGTSPITYYQIYRNGVLISTVHANQYYYNDTNVVDGQNYTYYVTAINSAGESTKSNEVSATPRQSIPEMQTFWLPVIALLILLEIIRKQERKHN